MVSVYTQHLGASDIVNGKLNYADSTGDIWCFLKTDNAVAELEIEMPETEETNDQTFGLTTKSAINALTLTTSKEIIGGTASFVAAGTKLAWTYNTAHQAWFITS